MDVKRATQSHKYSPAMRSPVNCWEIQHQYCRLTYVSMSCLVSLTDTTYRSWGLSEKDCQYGKTTAVVLTYHIEIIRGVMYTRANTHEQCYEEPHYSDKGEGSDAVLGSNAPENTDECVDRDDLMVSCA